MQRLCVAEQVTSMHATHPWQCRLAMPAYACRDVPVVQDPLAEANDDLSRAIIDAEVNTNAWTLMHRSGQAGRLPRLVHHASGQHSSRA